jgi:hypothetical protein
MHALNAGLAFGFHHVRAGDGVSSLVETLHRLFGTAERGWPFLLATSMTASSPALRGDPLPARRPPGFIE